MEKKESFKKEPQVSDASENEGFAQTPPVISEKLAWLSNKIFGIVKFLLGILLLPFVYSTTAALIGELALLEKPLEYVFWSGVITLVLGHFFIWEPAVIYAKGQKILEFVFTFVRPLVKVAPFLLPIYSLLLIVVYAIISAFHPGWKLNYFVFLLGVTISLHLIFSAKSMRSRKGDFLKGNYIFGFGFIYILNLILLAACFAVISSRFSFVDFSKATYYIATGIFKSAFKQLFL